MEDAEVECEIQMLTVLFEIFVALQMDTIYDNPQLRFWYKKL
jgi:hypothetical protein